MVTLKQIAEKAGLSISTISHILNRQSPRYNAQTRERVRKIAEAMGYIPNRYAQVIRRGRSGIIGMIQHAGLLQVAVLKSQAAARAIVAANYRLLAGDSEWSGSGIQTICATMLDLRVEGLILIDPPATFPRDELDRFQKHRIPVVALGGVRIKGVPQIRVDAEKGMEMIVRHVAALGHRDLELVVPALPPRPSPAINWPTLERVAGFRRAARQAGLTAAQAKVTFFGAPNDIMSPYANGKAAMEQILARGERPRAVLFCNDDWAIGALAACAEAGVKVPDQIAITGFDNAPIGEYLPSPLTTVTQDFEGMAKAATDLLLERIRERDWNLEAPLIRVPGRLIVRRSCGAHAVAPSADA